MPIYEYRCQRCGQKSDVFFRTFSAVTDAHCPHCDSEQVDRLVSRVAFLKSWGSSLDWMPSGESMFDVDQDDPQAMEGWLQRMRREQGTEMGDSFADTMTRMDAGIEPPWFNDASAAGDDSGEE